MWSIQKRNKKKPTPDSRHWHKTTAVVSCTWTHRSLYEIVLVVAWERWLNGRNHTSRVMKNKNMNRKGWDRSMMLYFIFIHRPNDNTFMRLWGYVLLYGRIHTHARTNRPIKIHVKSRRATHFVCCCCCAVKISFAFSFESKNAKANSAQGRQ